MFYKIIVIHALNTNYIYVIPILTYFSNLNDFFFLQCNFHGSFSIFEGTCPYLIVLRSYD